MADQSEQRVLQMQMRSLFSLMQLCGAGEMERGPRYRAYAHLRESRLRLNNEMKTTPSPSPSPKANFKKRAVTFSPEVGKSVPDFSATLRKENRKPPDAMMMTMTKTKNDNTSPLFPRGRSVSASPSDKRMGVRKSFTAFNNLNSIPIQHTTTLATARPPKTNTFLPNYRRL